MRTKETNFIFWDEPDMGSFEELTAALAFDTSEVVSVDCDTDFVIKLRPDYGSDTRCSKIVRKFNHLKQDPRTLVKDIYHQLSAECAPAGKSVRAINGGVVPAKNGDWLAYEFEVGVFVEPTKFVKEFELSVPIFYNPKQNTTAAKITEFNQHSRNTVADKINEFCDGCVSAKTTRMRRN